MPLQCCVCYRLGPQANPAVLARVDLMFLLENTTGEMRTNQRSAAFLSNATAALGLLALGFPLTPAAIRATLLGLAVVFVAVTRFMLGCFRIADPCAQKFCEKEKTRG
jgi:hypothetical protein